MRTLEQRANKWLLGSNVGISSSTMLAIHLGEKTAYHGSFFDAPYDVSDFRRCYELLQLIPEIRQSFPVIARKVKSFRGIIENWDEIASAYELEKGQGKCPNTYELIKKHRL